MRKMDLTMLISIAVISVFTLPSRSEDMAGQMVVEPIEFGDVQTEIGEIQTENSDMEKETGTSAEINNSTIEPLAGDLSSVKSNSHIWRKLSSDCDSLIQISVTPRRDGYVMVTATGTISLKHNSGNSSDSYICLDLHDSLGYCGGCTPMINSKSAIRTWVPKEFTETTEFGIPFNIVETFPVQGGKEYSYYLKGKISDSSDTAWLFHPTLTAVFFQESLP